jgi:hypothetical protein
VSIKVFDIKVAPAKLKFALYFHHRWEKDRFRYMTWPTHHWHVDAGVNYYEGLTVRGTNVHPKDFIFHFNLMPVFKIVLDVTWRYKQQFVLKIEDPEEE